MSTDREMYKEDVAYIYVDRDRERMEYCSPIKKKTIK